MKRTFCFALAVVCWLGFSAVSFAAPTSAEPTVQAASGAPAAKGHRRHRRHHRRHHRHHRKHGGHKMAPKKG